MSISFTTAEIIDVVSVIIDIVSVAETATIHGRKYYCVDVTIAYYLLINASLISSLVVTLSARIWRW
jgi:hypothetical protein